MSRLTRIESDIRPQTTDSEDSAERIFRAIDRFVGTIEKALESIAQIALLGLMLLTAASAVMRYLFSAPIVMSLDITAMYIVPALVWLAVPRLHADQGHIRATFLLHTFGGLRRKLIELMTELIILAATILMFLGAWGEMWSNTDTYITGQISLAVMPSWIFAVLGLGGLAVRVLITTYGLILKPSSAANEGNDTERVTDIA